MDPNYGRPQFGDIFCPPRHVLNSDNDYLCTVGLIIFIRGALSPNFFGLVTQRMATLHGGRPSEYNICQATITPYLITCQNAQVRNTIVQRNIYTIPHTQIQFTVHEWRSRFGMGYDPPSHQVWVKIIDLPLQVWTESEIYAVLQEFRHPIQILPFEKAAGHYRDITALVNTHNPNRIFRAYTNKEEDYSTQIEIVILTCRRWKAGYYPPSDNTTTQQNRQLHQQQQNNQVSPYQRASSSSSSDSPFEPTVDLSTWSPRSYQLETSSPPKQSTKAHRHPNLFGSSNEPPLIAPQPYPPHAHSPTSLWTSKAVAPTQPPSLTT